MLVLHHIFCADTAGCLQQSKDIQIQSEPFETGEDQKSDKQTTNPKGKNDKHGEVESGVQSTTQ